MEVYEALGFAKANFPNAPELLAEKLGIRIEYSPLAGCEGWCIGKEGRYLVRINSNSGRERQRFTLAHEIGHILLAETPDVLPLMKPSVHFGMKKTQPM